MKRVHYALTAFAALFGICSAFSSNHKTSKTASDVLYWYQPGSNDTITATLETAESICPAGPMVCLKGHSERLASNPSSPTIYTVFGPSLGR